MWQWLAAGQGPGRKKLHINAHKGNTKSVKKSNISSYHSLTTMTSESSSKIVFLNLHISRSTNYTNIYLNFETECLITSTFVAHSHPFQKGRENCNTAVYYEK